MFKSMLWRSEKNKIKAVFKLQFHAIQVSHVGGDGLVVSVVPADVGKPTVKLKKATLRDGSCYWDDPVYETIKFTRDSKSGNLNEKIYCFFVRSSKGEYVGEASIDMSSYSSATKITPLSLPLKNSKSDILLQVSIERIPESVDQRFGEERESVKLISQSLRVPMNNSDMERSSKIAPMEDREPSKTINSSAKMNGKQRPSSMSDFTISTSTSDESLRTNTPQSFQTKNDSIHQESNGFFSSMNQGIVVRSPVSDAPAAFGDKRKKSLEWLGGLALESSSDYSSGNPRENSRRDELQVNGDISFEKLSYELTVLSRQLEMSYLELERLRKQVVKENQRGNNLSEEVTKLKEERDIFKEECEKLKSLPFHLDESTARSKLHLEGGDLPALLAELRQELYYEKGLNNNLKFQLQKTQEVNAELLLAVSDLDEMLQQKNKEIANPPYQSDGICSLEGLPEENCKDETDNDDEEQKALEELVMVDPDAKDVYILEEKIMELRNEIQIYRREKEEIEGHMEQVALDYEILKQENHDMSNKLEQSELQEQLRMQYDCSSSYAILNELESQIESLENELHQKSLESSDSLNTISDLEIRVKDLEDELKKTSRAHSDSLIVIRELEDEVKVLEDELEAQAQGFETDLESLTHAKVEQEQRAIKAEDSLRKLQRQNASVAELLQEELRKLSVQMVTAFEANESQTAKALTEANQLRMQKGHLEGKLKEASKSLQRVKEQYEARMHELSAQVGFMSKQVEELQSKILDKSNQLEHELMHAEEVQTHFAKEISMLNTQLATLDTENKAFAKQLEERESLMSELDQIRRSFSEVVPLFEEAMKENVDLETRLVLVKERTGEILKEIHPMFLKNEKELLTKDLQLEIDSLKAQRSELKQLLSNNELEKENLRQQVYRLKSGPKSKEDALNSIKKKPKDINGRGTVADGAKAAKKNMSQSVSSDSKKIANLEEKIRMLEGVIKQKDSTLEYSTKSFLEKEKDLQTKLEELEQRLEVFNDNMPSFSEQDQNKASKISEELSLKIGLSKAVRDTSENLSNTIWVSGQCIPPGTPIVSNLDNLEGKELKFSASEAGKLSKVLVEMALMNEKNKQMEFELKEMQERYSEVSLKFAEVEGERQQLVMKLRNLKRTPLA